MNAKEAADIATGVQNADHSGPLLTAVRDAARKGERSLDIGPEVTAGTIAALERLGYSVRQQGRTYWHSSGPRGWVVSW